MEQTFPAPKETSLQRAYGYPVVKDTLDTAHSYVASNSYSNALYERAANIAASVLQRLEPLQKRLPLETVDSYANGALDYVEKTFPSVKSETSELVAKPREAADHAVAAFYARVGKSQETLHGLQDRLAKTVAKFPHDQASIKKTLNEYSAELDSVVKSIPSLPAQAQAHAQPYLEGLGEAAQYVKKELTSDAPLAEKASNILHYSQEKLTPVFESVKSYAFKTKKQAEEKGEEVKETATSE
ncbi:uncharacterized protein JCM6883_004842 [Sporobolomyces salmoneus]|uniref:uncharacterized protein n=1 Tax=Sporobolomyces salmoneus TaxID=183962 RepID=UPI00317C4737